jgi:hypothetical protein
MEHLCVSMHKFGRCLRNIYPVSYSQMYEEEFAHQTLYCILSAPVYCRGNLLVALHTLYAIFHANVGTSFKTPHFYDTKTAKHKKCKLFL